MPGHHPVRLNPADRKPLEPVPNSYLPLALLLALNLEDGGQPGSEGVEQNPALPPEAEPQVQSAAVFPQDESSPIAAYFVADTAFDCDDAGDAADWFSFED